MASVSAWGSFVACRVTAVDTARPRCPLAAWVRGAVGPTCAPRSPRFQRHVPVVQVPPRALPVRPPGPDAPPLLLTQIHVLHFHVQVLQRVSPVRATAVVRILTVRPLPPAPPRPQEPAPGVVAVGGSVAVGMRVAAAVALVGVRGRVGCVGHGVMVGALLPLPHQGPRVKFAAVVRGDAVQEGLDLPQLALGEQEVGALWHEGHQCQHEDLGGSGRRVEKGQQDAAA